MLTWHYTEFSLAQFYYLFDKMKNYSNRNLIVKGQSEDVGNLWLGDFESARNKKSLRNDKITAVVTAGLGMKLSYTSDIRHKMLPLYDSEGENIYRFFDSTFEFIDDALKNGNVLIHCYAGISRSTTILAAYLMRKNQWRCRETLNLIKKSRFVIGPNKGFMNQLRRFQSSGMSSSKIQQSTQNSSKYISNEEQKTSKNFVQGFLSYKRDTSLFQKYKNNLTASNQRSKTAAKTSNNSAIK